ncbi:MAG: GDSL-type esterase/lipase family protein [Opitutaceae bacterium]|nr:GDSL-type esterase/lipase family protein [Opitutaceae bacterium]
MTRLHLLRVALLLVVIPALLDAQPAPKPDLVRFGLDEKTGSRPRTIEPIATSLPLTLRRGDRIVLIGNTLFERGDDYPHFEAMLHTAFPQLDLTVRTLAWSADEIDLMPRPKNFGDLQQHLTAQRADVIFAAYGFNESFGGAERLAEFRARLVKFLTQLRTSAYNGGSAPRIVLVSPIANENVPGIPAADLNNARLEAYTRAMGAVAAEQQVGFVDVFAATRAALADPATQLTDNGVHLGDAGYAAFARALFEAAFVSPAPKPGAELVAAVADKNRQFFRRYRPLNTYYYTGDRNATYGYLDFLPAMQGFDVMLANRDARLHGLARGEKFSGKPIDDSNVPAMPPVDGSKAANEWMTPANELAAFKVDPRFEVNLFASEEQFPDLAKPIQLRWDARGRLWVSCSTTYPHVYPGREPADKIVILEDTDGDGRADKCTVFADKLHIPLSFEFADGGGIYVSEQPHLTFLQDTDGDDRADVRRVIFSGFGTEDSHHSLHDFIRTPDGDLLFREAIFQNSQVETPYGPVRARNSSWFQFNPATHRLTAFGSYPNTNPWGVTFTAWGHHVASHPIFASAFHATNPPFPQQHADARGLPAYSGTCGHEFVDSPVWPPELQGRMIKARYKPTNRIEIHDWKQIGDHFEESYVSDLIFSTNLSFIPVDVKFGPRGDLYVCDWYNPIKGHMQYSLRDERRDRTSGRIWRVVPKGAVLPPMPRLAGASLAAQIDLLKAPESRVRDLARRELAARGRAAVEPALHAWVRALDPKDALFRRHQLEALWLSRALGAPNLPLLRELIACAEPLARAAATHQLRHAHALLPDALELLRARAADASGLVRMEAAIAASYLGTMGALEAILPALEKPADAHLAYAIRTSLESEALARHWKGHAHGPAAHAAAAYVARADQAAKAATKAVGGKKKAADADPFDRQPDLFTITISSVPERMVFDVKSFAVKPGQPVKLVFRNPDAMQHNLVVVRPGALEEVGVAANEMAKDPDGIKKDFVPKSEKVLHATKLIDPHAVATLRFRAPTAPGLYPYVCTFPGHWPIMNGVMEVKP